MTKIDVSSTEKISPSQFMRGLRPEYYSDTEDRVAYLLDKSTLEYYLETITPRNETHEFEIFCRKLCERTICPNLRPQTGPDGGGDSKADTETYPVADEISALYIGDANGGRERWAFPISAQKTWSKKVRSDVQGIVETGRSYDRIIFVTSRFARAKDRARIEDELSKKYSIPVTIHDRSWIVKEIIDSDRKDIAFNYLGIGDSKNDPLRLGPKDYSRSQQLEDIERSLDDPEAYCGMEQQRATEALVVAKLSRNLERPRTETDGRFLRAIRLAEADGTYRQKLEARYEHIWSAFWWFDDFQFLKDSYESFETLALKSDHAISLELLCNLLQLFVNSVIHDHISPDECQLEERTSSLQNALGQIAKDKKRPNASLEAELSLLIIRINQKFINNEYENLSFIWGNFATILEKAKGLGEFNADRLVNMIEAVGHNAGNDPAYNDLVEKLAEFVSNRKSEAEGALILLKRAEKLDFSDNFDMIRFLGKAAIGLAKKEYSDHLIEAFKLLALAYRSAGMLWAARASCIFLASCIIIEGEEESDIPVAFIPIMKLWAWLAIELSHIPDFVFAIQMLNGALATIPLTEESRVKGASDIQDLDAALGSLILNLDDADLIKLKNTPDILDAMGLFMSRSALLYILGYADTLRADGSLPVDEPEEKTNAIFSVLASQPVAKNLRGPIKLNDGNKQILNTTILGMSVGISIDGNIQSILVAEAVLASLEAFFATTIEQRVIPHTEKLYITLVGGDEASKPSFELNTLDMAGTLVWPDSLSLTNFEQQKDVHNILTEVSGRVLSATCVVDDIKSLLNQLYGDEAVHNRMKMAAFCSNSYSRLANKCVSRMSDWQDLVQDTYELRNTRPTLEHVEFNDEDIAEAEVSEDRSYKPPKITDHRKLNIRSVIDVHAWDQARWKGTAYAQFSPSQPMCVALLFENEEGARKIFEHWLERFGRQDKNEEIYLSIIREMPHQNNCHYCVQISSKLPDAENRKSNKVIVMASRSMTMTPNSDVNLKRFLESYHHFGAFYLMPATLCKKGEPELLFDLAILKHELTVKLAEDVSEHDIEAMALRSAADVS